MTIQDLTNEELAYLCDWFHMGCEDEDEVHDWHTTLRGNIAKLLDEECERRGYEDTWDLVGKHSYLHDEGDESFRPH